MSWLKLTSKALYLMQGGTEQYISKVALDSTGNSTTLDVPLDWFTGSTSNLPRTMIVDVQASVEPAQFIPPIIAGTLKGKKIVLDPGHGEEDEQGIDPGAVGFGTSELVENIIQADEVAKYLRSKGASVAIVPNSENLDLWSIGARGRGADAFVSLHLNAFNGKVQKHEVLILPDASQEDKQLAELISKELQNNLPNPPFKNGGFKSQSLGVLNGVPDGVPKVLTEALFIDAPGMSRENVVKAAQAIARGIENFLLK
jgi:N-acetylmuramoyl-L-alanine amidase